MSRSAEGYADALAAQGTSIVDKEGERATFEDLGLHAPMAASFRTAFPNVLYPTETQREFIPAILEGKDVLLSDVTGSGKSFGLVIALLNKPRTVLKGTKTENADNITSLVIVPHRDLAYQLFHWIQKVVNVSNTPPSLSSVVQVLVRDGGSHLGNGLSTLKEQPPHILIGTPQALVDIYRSDSQALQLSTLSSVVVDEVDYLVETVPRKDPQKSFYKATKKAEQKIQAHPGVTRQLLDIIFARRKELNERRRDEPGLFQQRRRANILDGPMRQLGTPQLILSSATIRTHLKNYLFDESGWLDKDNVLKVAGNKVKRNGRLSSASHQNDDGAKATQHSVILVSEHDIRNISGAMPPIEDSSEGEGSGQRVSPAAVFALHDEDGKESEHYSTTRSPFNPNALEAIATAFAVDVPSVALLVLPASSPLQRAVHELRELGVNAYGLDLHSGTAGRSHLLSGGEAVSENPTLLVSTLATTRGLDLPELTHVFILGIPEGPKVNARSVDAYVHIAGRVGRFGRGGKVITVVEDDEKEEEEAGKVVSEGSKMKRILGRLEITPVRFEPFV